MSGPSMAHVVAAVSGSKADDPLRMVTVIVPSSGARRDVTRALARNGGAANTRLLTLDDAVDLLAAPALAPRLPLPYSLLEASIERILDDEPGLFAEVAGQPITAQALAGASFELTGYSDPAVHSPTKLVREMLRIHRIATAVHAENYYLRHEAYAAALARLDHLGEIIVYLPTSSDAAVADLLAAMQARGTTVGDADTVHGTLVVHASDADDEVRAVARIARAHIAEGIPGHRIGVFYGSRDPYLRLLHEHLAAAGIAFTAAECHSLADRPVARSLIALLTLDLAELPRRDLLAALAEQALRRPETSGGSVSQARLERLTRKYVPIVSGSDWDRLASVSAEEWFYEVALATHAFVASLRNGLAAIGSARTWADAAAAIATLLADHFVEPQHDRAARDLAALTSIVSSLAELDGIAPTPSFTRITDALAMRIESATHHVGETSAAVTVGPLSAGAGRDLEVSIIVGAAEGIIPARRRADPLRPAELTPTT